jgi:tRNA(His) 5'-end guanylyltransferase
MLRDDLGQRMKTYYEEVPKFKLMRRTPVAIRIDGKAFHTFTRGFEKPFDEVLGRAMRETMKYLCENIQGCVLGYTQSDEITLILIDYQTFNTSAWFDYEIQKMCSIAASMATMAFNKFFWEESGEVIKNAHYEKISESYKKYVEILMNARQKGAMFDARVFNIPKEEVANLIYWRQLDATRNSIQMVGQANFSHKELQNKSCNDIQDMLMTQKGINWNDFPTHLKRGSCCVKQETGWVIDTEIPIFKNEGRDYIDNLIFIENEV